MPGHFKGIEFACRCGCGKSGMDKDFIDMLDRLRDLHGAPVYITSGFRCEAHNRAEGGKLDSAHLSGIAADLMANTSSERFSLVASALRTGFKRIGIGRGFIHVDTDCAKPQKAIWLYK